MTPAIEETPRCELCKGIGVVDGDYCSCQLGKDLKLVELRHRAALNTCSDDEGSEER